MRRLRNIVLTWTLVTTTFAWTTTMRLVLKPEISRWQIFDVGGTGMEGEFWLPPLVALIALGAFYLEGRGRLRPLFHAWLITWHVLLSALCLYGALQAGGEFQFATWDVTAPFWLLTAPFLVFLAMAAWLVVMEIRRQDEIPKYEWHRVDHKSLALAAATLPVAIVLFRLGEDFDGWVKLAVATTILQWVLLVDAVGRPAATRDD